MPKQKTLSEETLKLLKNRRELKQEKGNQRIEYAETYKPIRKRMKNEIRQYNMNKIERTIQEDRSLRKKGQLILGKSQIITLKSSDGSIMNDRDEIISRVEELYQYLYSSKKKIPKPDINIDEDQVPDITREEVKKALEDIKKGKVPGEDQVLIVPQRRGGGHSRQTAC